MYRHCLCIGICLGTYCADAYYQMSDNLWYAIFKMMHLWYVQVGFMYLFLYFCAVHFITFQISKTHQTTVLSNLQMSCMLIIYSPTSLRTSICHIREWRKSHNSVNSTVIMFFFYSALNTRMLLCLTNWNLLRVYNLFWSRYSVGCLPGDTCVLHWGNHLDCALYIPMTLTCCSPYTVNCDCFTKGGVADLNVATT